MSGQKIVSFFKKNCLSVFSGILLLAVMCSVTAYLIWMEEQNYREKIDILVRMTESGGDMNTAAGLLKGQEVRGIEGSMLEDYGYSQEGNNYYLKMRQRNMWGIIGVSSAVYFLFLVVLVLVNRGGGRRKKEIFAELEEIVGCFRKGEQINLDSYSREETTGILMELEALGNTIAIWREESRKEREGVKSLVTDISHQLKTPVAALKASVEILQQEDLQKEEREEFLKRCSQQLRGLENLLSALIQISRMETGMIEIKKESLSIFQTLVDAVSRVYVKAEEKEIEIELESEEELESLKLPHDKKWLCEAFINLLENAIKYSPRGKHVTIRMAKRITFLRIEIEDEGIGIAKGEYHQIFKRFYRGSAKEVQEEEGSGVGLYLTREIISRHGGTVSVHSRERMAKEQDSGSVFVIQLPYQ